jgi:hypothetical protein
MNRRRLLQVAGSTLVVGSGCTGNDEPEIQDSDGDVVIDSKDYAPNDPAVQEKSDLLTTATATATTTPTPTATPTATPTEMPTSNPDEGQLVVDDSYWEGVSHITSFGTGAVTTMVTADHPETEFDSAKLLLQVYQFPRERLLSETLSAQFDRTAGPHTITVNPDLGRTDGSRHQIQLRCWPCPRRCHA